MSHTRFDIKNVSGATLYVPYIQGGKEKHRPVVDDGSVVSEEILEAHLAGQTKGTLELKGLPSVVGSAIAIGDLPDANATDAELALKALKSDAIAASDATAASVEETTVDGSDAATTQTLVNSLKVKYNTLQAEYAATVTLVNELKTRIDVMNA